MIFRLQTQGIAMNRTALLLASLFAAMIVASAPAAPPSGKPQPAEVPPPPGLDDPGVETTTAVKDADPEAAPQAAQDPLAPLPKPDSRLVRDKASRDRAATAERVAASDVSSRRQGDDTIEEYRQNGRIWMIKIHQARGPVQTFYADDGSGRLMRDPNEGPVSPVYFTLYEWK